MSGGRWSTKDKAIAVAFSLISGIILAFAIYWSGTLAGYQEGRGVEASTRHEAQAKHQVEQACGALTGISLIECVYDETAASQEAKTSEQDLKAQQGMERWAFLMFVAAFSQTLVASSALFFLMQDLQQNRRSSELQLRAYVLPVNVGFEWRASLRDGGCTMHIWVNIRNDGDTPVRNMKLVVGHSHILCESQQFSIVKPLGQTTLLGPNQDVRSPHVLVAQDHIQKVFEQAADLYIFGAAFYDDVFGSESHVTRFCYKIDFTRTDKSDMPDGLNWAYIGLHNCSDAECSANEAIALANDAKSTNDATSHRKGK